MKERNSISNKKSVDKFLTSNNVYIKIKLNEETITQIN